MNHRLFRFQHRHVSVPLLYRSAAEASSPAGGRPGEGAAECGLSFAGAVCFGETPSPCRRLPCRAEPRVGQIAPVRNRIAGDRGTKNPLAMLRMALSPLQGAPWRRSGRVRIDRTMRYFGAGAGGAPPRHGLWPRPISPFQGAFGRLRLPQRRPAGGGGGQRLSGGCNDGCISTYCHNIYRITIRFALSSAARRAALRPALPAERPLKGGDGPCEAWRGGSPRSKLHQQRIIRTLPRFCQGAPCKGEGTAPRSGVVRGSNERMRTNTGITRTLPRLRQGAP